MWFIMVGQSRQEECEAAGHWCCLQEAESDEFWCSAGHLYIQAMVPPCGLLLPTVKVSLPTPVNLI